MGIRYFWGLVFRLGFCATAYFIIHSAEPCLITNETFFIMDSLWKAFALDTVWNMFILTMIETTSRGTKPLVSYKTVMLGQSPIVTKQF